MYYGQIIQLGNHRLMCGDATKGEDIEKLIGDDKIDLVLTDPPYGMKIQYIKGGIGGGTPNTAYQSVAAHLTGSIGGCPNPKKDLPNSGTITRCKQYPLLIGDNNQESARKHYELIQDLTKHKVIWGGQYFAHFLPISGAWIFWDKENGGTDFSDGELAWRSWGKKIVKYTHKWNGAIRSGSQTLNGKSRIHPTQKPVELHMSILEDYSEPGDVVLDCFGGSGTTLIACNETGRKCLMMEISPEYCDIIVERYEKLTRQMRINNSEIRAR